MPGLDDDECRQRLAEARHAVLGTIHAERGPDLVPVVHALVTPDVIALPVDRVKAKRTVRLARVANLARDPRATVLVDAYDDDWEQLWWVRAGGRATMHHPSGPAIDALAERYDQYRLPGTIDALILLDVERWTGWAA